jgi:tryptophanase
MFGRQPDGSEKMSAMELVRLAFPRRVYTQSHVDYVAEVLRHVSDLRHRIRGVKMVDEPPTLRHFSARFAPAHEALIADE